ncbi:uncharacterized protein [Dermacentor andersoni]|uniref:uncharacterized protein isoform X1 n=1 Tax=Dermacentor andersoni TaxID=34620 RepID=UPI003B3B13CE
MPAGGAYNLGHRNILALGGRLKCRRAGEKPSSLRFFQASLFVLCAITTQASCTGDFVDETRDRPSRVRANNLDPPAPYSFVYGSSDKGGSHGREETRDEHGTVRGSYRIALADGRMRVVKYVADKDGFRAGIATNEQGTESGSSSGVVVNSQALSGPDAARAAHRSMTRAGASRHSAPRRAAAASSNVERWAAPSQLRAPGYLPAQRDEIVYYEP